MNTAGLGGVGGPYRMDGGGDAVFQVADWEKAQVPEEVSDRTCTFVVNNNCKTTDAKRGLTSAGHHYCKLHIWFNCASCKLYQLTEIVS